MPLLKCRDCMHEWEGRTNSLCDWCGGNSRILAKETSMEKLFRKFWSEDVNLAEVDMDKYRENLERIDKE